MTMSRISNTRFQTAQRIVGWTLLSVVFMFSCRDNSAATSRVGSGTPVENPPAATERKSGVIDHRLVAANNRFGFRLYAELSDGTTAGNIFICPPSVAIALAMTCNGADGVTRDAMIRTLGLSEMPWTEVNMAYAGLREVLRSPDSSVELAIANALWARMGLRFKESFFRQNENAFGARIAELDFGSPAAVPAINAWARENTQGRIPAIVGPAIDPATVLLLVNAIYFKGAWTLAFDTSLTRKHPFHLLDGSRKQHPLMFRSGDYEYLREEGFQAVRLPYGHGSWAMYVFLPDADSDLKTFQRGLIAENWERWMSGFREQEGEVALPRFRTEYQSGLTTALERLGMGVAFSADDADFSRMLAPSPGVNAFISDVVHKTFVEVNEKGTEAAAATAVSVGITSIQEPPRRFRMVVDRPFFFAIHDRESQSILFMGAIVEPEIGS